MDDSSRTESGEAPPTTSTAPQLSHEPKSATPLEMSNPTPQAEPLAGATADPSISPLPATEPTAGEAQSSTPAANDVSQAETDAAAPPPLQRAETEAIGPASDTPAAKPDTTAGPVVVITLLLTSGARHPYKIDEKYLRKRNVEVESMDPFNISVYTLKELIWRDWREEWEPRPTSPSSIRLISFGRMLDDKQPLKECRFQTESPNVVHMTVKPQEVVDEEDAKTAKGGSRDHDGDEPTARCRCVIL